MRALRLLPLLLIVTAFAHTRARAGGQPARTPQFIDGVRDTGQFLPDTTWLVQVGPRVTSVRDFVSGYFDSYPEDRPKPDSLGRVRLLNSIIEKDVLGMTALGIDTKLGFEDRLQLRETQQRALSNAVYQRLVIDSVKVTEDDIREAGKMYGYEQRFRHITFSDRATAERVRRDLLGGKLRWSDAVRRYSIAKHDPGPDGELGWAKRANLDPSYGLRIFALKPGEMSVIFIDKDGFQLVQALERRPIPTVALEPLHNTLRTQLVEFRTTERSESIQQVLRDEIAIAYDTLNIDFAAKHFKSPTTVEQTNKGSSIAVDAAVPEFTPADTARVLARWKNGGRFTIQQLLRAYSDLTPMLRPNLSFWEAVRGQVDAIVLEPFMADYAVRRGLDKDPAVVRELAKKREQILVEHMYQDSVGSRVWVSKDERRAYYEKNKAQFVTYPAVDFAAIVRPSKKSVDSLVAALKGGADARAILRSDSLAGNVSGSVQHRVQNEGGQYQKILFEELRPGQTATFGPDKQGTYIVLQLLTFDAGHQLTFEQSDQMADESLQNIKAEQALRAMIERMKKKYTIRSRPELVMRIRLIDPTL